MKTQELSQFTPGRNRSSHLASVCLIAFALMVQSSFAATTILTWDANTGSTGAQDGSGTWDAGTSSTNWWNGTGNFLWPNTTTTIANIGTNSGAAGTITVSGTVTLNGINFSTPGSGSYTLSGGTLSLGGTTPTIKAAVATLTPTINSVIAESSAGTAVLFSGASISSDTITLGGTNTFTGTATVSIATVKFNVLANGGAPSSFGAGANTVPVVVCNSSSAAAATYTGGIASTDRPWTVSGTATSGGAINNNGTGPISLNNTTAAMTGAAGVRILFLGGTYAGSPNTFAELVSDTGTGTNISNLRIGNQSATASYWNVTGANTHSGGTYLNSTGSGAILGIGNPSALGTGTFLVSNTCSFDNTTGGDIAVSNLFTLGGSPTYIGSAHNLAINGNATLTVSPTITVSTNTLTLGGQITGAFTLTKSGAGTLVLNNIGAADAHNATTISAGTLDLGGTSQSLGNVTFSGAATTQNGTINGSNYFGTLATGTAIVTANLAGSGTLTHSGAGALALLGGNTYNGGTTISGSGTLLLTNDTGLGNTNSGVTFSGNGALAVTNFGAAVSNNVTINSTRTITVNTNIIANFTTPDTNNLTINAFITGLGGVTKKGSSFSLGTVRFANDTNNYTGDFTAGFGNTEFTSVANQGSASSLGVGAVATGGTITLNNGNSSGTLRYVGSSNSATLRPLNWTGTTATYTLDSSGTGFVQFLASGNLKSGLGAAEFRLRGSNTGSNIFAQVINDSGVGTNTLFNKFDAGMWILTGANTFSGPTGVNAGTLWVNGSLSAASVVTVTNGNLGGTGTINGPVTVLTAGNLAPGTTSPGVLHINNTLTLASTATLRINKGGLSDQVAGLASITNGGTLNVTSIGQALASGDSFTLFSSSNYSGAFATVNLPSLAANLVWDTSMLAQSGIITVGELPVIVTPPTNEIAECSGNAAFSVTAAGTGPLYYQWSFGGVPVMGETNTSFTAMDVHPPGPITVSVTISNVYGGVTTNATLTVVDTTPPVVTLIGSNMITVECHGTFTDPGATALDACAGSLGVNVTGSVDPNTPGSYLLTYSATDPSTNTGSVTRTVLVTDTTPPVITFNFTNLVLNADTNCSAVMPDVTGTNYILAADLCSGTNITITQTPTNNSLLPLGTNIVVLAVADASGNTNYSTNTIMVVAPTTLAIVASSNPSLPGSNVTFAATINHDSSCAPAPTGEVAFTDGTNALALVAVDDTNLVTLTTNSLSHGNHVITAVYSGDGYFLGSTNTLTELINTPPVAGPATYARQRDLSLQIAVSDLLTNAIDADGDAISLLSVSPTSTNGATITLTNSFVIYTPPATNGNVTDAFSYTVSDTFGATNTGNVTVNIAAETPVNISSVSVLPDGTVQLDFSGTPSHYYFIEAATNLDPAVWITLSTNQADTNGLFQYLDLDATNFPLRFYRTSIP